MRRLLIVGAAVGLLAVFASVTWPLWFVAWLFLPGGPPPCEFMQRWPAVAAPEGGLWAQAHQEACGDGGFVTIVYTVVTLGGADSAAPEEVLRVAETDMLDQALSLGWTTPATLTVRLAEPHGVRLQQLRRLGVAVELMVPPERRVRPSP